jgi:hypothetical protein
MKGTPDLLKALTLLLKIATSHPSSSKMAHPTSEITFVNNLCPAIKGNFLIPNPNIALFRLPNNIGFKVDIIYYVYR